MAKDDALDEVVEFYDAHPGFAGATIPIPAKVKKVADDLSGGKLKLRDAIARLKAVTKGTVKAVREHKYISLMIHVNGCTHGFRVIRYR